MSESDSSFNLFKSLNLAEGNGLNGMEEINPEDLLFEDIDVLPLEDDEVYVDLENSPYEEQWEKLKSVFEGTNADTTMLQALYSEFGFIMPFVCRKMFADEIEKKCWDVINTDEDYAYICDFTQNGRQAKKIVQDLLQAVSVALTNNQLSMDDMITLENWKKELENQYMKDPFRFVQFMLKLLKKEKAIIEMAEQQMAGGQGSGYGGYDNGEESMMGVNEQIQAPVDLMYIQQISGQLNELKEKSCEIGRKIEKCVTDLQRLSRHTHGDIATLDRYDLNAIADTSIKRNIELLRMMKYTFITERQEIINSHGQEILTPLKVGFLGVQEQIKAWQRSQAYVENGKIHIRTCDIDQLEACCRLMAHILYVSMEQILVLAQKKIDINEDQSILANLITSYECLVKELVAKSLVVEKQPPQVLMKDKKFGCRLRHLVGDGLGQVRFDTEISLISTEMACEVLEKGPTTKIKCSGKILNNTTKSDFIEQTRQLQVQMRNMSLSMRQRGDRGRAAIVAEEKFCMIYRAKFPVRFPSNTQCDVISQTMSLPIIVISHGKQEADAQATVFWDNAFSELNRVPFLVPETVRWGWILDSLHCLWVKNCQKKQDLRQRNTVGLDNKKTEQYLTNKLFGIGSRGKIGYDTMVSWRNFNRDNLPELPFTFWMWFFKTMELVSHDLVRPYWNEGLIRGFISKKDCHDELSQCPPGTFMFRFSDSQPGALSISCYSHSKEHGGRLEVGHLEPDQIKDLQRKEIPDLVNDLHYLKSLHTFQLNIPKTQVFQKKIRKASDGYTLKRLAAISDNFAEDRFGGDPGFVHSPTGSFAAPSPGLASPSPSFAAPSPSFGVPSPAYNTNNHLLSPSGSIGSPSLS